MPDSILTGVNSIIDEELALKDERLKYRHPRCRLLSTRELPNLNGEVLIERILNQIKSNWSKGASRSKGQNWRWKKNPGIDKKNISQETILERWIVRTTGDEWVNQVPVASGLARGTGGRRAIDLVHQLENGWYELIELKVAKGGGTPLFAAMEILQYGVLYIFSRENALTLGYKKAEMKLLEAKGIHLKVIAPSAYYNGCDLSWLQNSLNKGLANFLVRHGHEFKMDFKFEVLSMIPSCSPVIWRT